MSKVESKSNPYIDEDRIWSIIEESKNLDVSSVIEKAKLAKGLTLEESAALINIEDDSFSYQRNEESINQEAELDGIYVIRSNISKQLASSEELVYMYKDLSKVEYIVLTGGEPTIHNDLPELIKKIREIGLKVKLDSNGTNPDLLRDLIDEKLVDYVAMDIKAPLEKYELLTGVPVEVNKIKRTINLIMQKAPDYEFRTTLVPGLLTLDDIRKIVNMPEEELVKEAKELGAPAELVQEVKKLGRLPVVNFAAGGVATPADAALMMMLGADGVFVGSGIFKSDNPEIRAKAIVESVAHFDDASVIAEVSKNLGEAMVGINIDEIPAEQRLQERGW